jgi:tRNA threonylcarbamoyladenosine biosynthesis protein TsaB
MFSLAFDTSTKTLAVSILQDGVILYDVVINNSLNHSEVLLSAINEACRQIRIKISDINLLACTLGPGSFTGLRIGISTLKGLMLATAKPAVGVSSLAALACNVEWNSKIVCSIIDAGRGQVYTAFYQKDEESIFKQINEEKALKPNEIQFDFDQEVIAVGDGAIKYADILTKNSKVSIASDQFQYIRASAVARLGREKFAVNDVLDDEKFAPLYLRSADALPPKKLF